MEPFIISGSKDLNVENNVKYSEILVFGWKHIKHAHIKHLKWNSIIIIIIIVNFDFWFFFFTE